jgi:hypothetical protein
MLTKAPFPAEGAPTTRGKGFYAQVQAMCAARLREALSPESALFSRQLRAGRWASTRGSEDVTSTAICLLGIHRAGIDPIRIDLVPHRTVDAMVNQGRRRRYPGAYGLILWANAVWDRLPTQELAARLGLPLWEPTRWVPTITTMEAAWVVSGLAHDVMRVGGPARDALADAVRALVSRFDQRTQLFWHCAPRAPLVQRVRRGVANFADQIYSVQALAFAAIVLGDVAILRVAEACASRLIEHQGPLGQWPWHYDPRDGGVTRFFPVYSVHQYGMAPMALAALAAAGAAPRTDAVERSVGWITNNELKIPLLDVKAGTIWRDIEPVERLGPKWIRQARSVIGVKSLMQTAGTELAINFETRPYEWGWCLYAGAIAEGDAAHGHVV